MQRPLARPPHTSLTARSQCHQVTPSTTARFRTASFETSFSQTETSSFSPNFVASAVALPRCIVSRCATAWAESLEGAIIGHQSWAVLCRYRCRLLLAEVPGVMRLQTDEHHGQRACALTARVSISNAMKGLVGGAKKLDLQPCFHGARAAELIPPMQNVPRRRGLLWVVEGAKQREAMREQGRSKTGIASQRNHLKRKEKVGSSN